MGDKKENLDVVVDGGEESSANSAEGTALGSGS